MIDIHSYPGESNSSDIVQGHRVYFDTTYNYPGANGVKTTAASGWDNSITKEFVLERCNRWLTQYMGANHGVTLGVSEYGATHVNANVTSVAYGSILGTFADNGVELFSPWYWNTGMWETMHLYSRYAKNIRVKSVSNQELNVSAYSSVNTANDSMTVILVNRHLTASRTVSMTVSNFAVPNGVYATKQLSNLPSSETFVSHTSNALVSNTVSLISNTFTINLPALSTTAIILKGTGSVTGIAETKPGLNVKLYPNPAYNQNAFIDLSGETVNDLNLNVFNSLGQIVFTKHYAGQNPELLEIPSANFNQGVYAVSLTTANGKTWNSWLVKM